MHCVLQVTGLRERNVHSVLQVTGLRGRHVHSVLQVTLPRGRNVHSACSTGVCRRYSTWGDQRENGAVSVQFVPGLEAKGVDFAGSDLVFVDDSSGLARVATGIETD